MDRDVWSSHQWARARGRQAETESGSPLVQRHCTRCMRDFVEDPCSGDRHGVYVSVFSFRMLPDQINQQWLAEMCPGAPIPLDAKVRGTLIERRIRQGRVGATRRTQYT